MSHVMTAEEIFYDLKRMPSPERHRFFTLLAANAFRDDNLTQIIH